MKLIFKGILFYTTVVAVVLFVCGIDSIYTEGNFIITFGIVAALIYACHKKITKEETDILLGSKLFGKLPENK